MIPFDGVVHKSGYGRFFICLPGAARAIPAGAVFFFAVRPLTVSFRASHTRTHPKVHPHAFRRIALAVLSLLALTHCAQNPVPGDRDKREVVPVSGQDAIQTGVPAHEDVLGEYPAVDQAALQAYVDVIGQKLARQSPRPDLPWHFTVVDSPDVNAFSLPGGYVYLTRGLLPYLNSEAQLAAVIGHEIGHVIAGHGVPPRSAATAAEVGAGLGSILASGPNDRGGASRVQALAPVWSRGYGRDLEREADRLGAECLARAGYDPRALVEFAGVLQKQESLAAEQARRDGRQLQTYHGVPATPPERDARLAELVDETAKYAVANPRVGRDEYLQKIDGVSFGDSPEQGVIRNNALLHEKLGLALQFPPGWLVRNRPGRVFAVNPAGDALVELLPGPKNDQPLDTLQKDLQLDPGARYDSGRLSGYPAAFAAGAQQGKPVVVAAVVFNGGQYLIAGISKDKAAYERERAALRNAINSFHVLTPAERLLARPHRVRVITAQATTTMAALARLSPLGNGAESQLRLMNALDPGVEPKPGQRLKIVQ